MTENDAIELLKASYITDLAGNMDNERMALSGYIFSALEELQQYREIGTVEQVRNQKHNLEVAYKIISDYKCQGNVKKQELKKQDIVMGNVEKILKEMHASAIYSQTKDGYGAMCVSIGTIERILRENMEGVKIMGEIKNNEAINELLFLKEKLYNGIFQERLGCIDYAIAMIKEAEQYREIGTLDEFREAKEKRTPMQPDVEGDGEADGFPVYDIWICPSCGEAYEIGYDDYDFCPKCGQKINRDILISMES